jgi:hypothetical protein
MTEVFSKNHSECGVRDQSNCFLLYWKYSRFALTLTNLFSGSIQAVKRPPYTHPVSNPGNRRKQEHEALQTVRGMIGGDVQFTEAIIEK